jgi:hypothetical protein
VALTRHPAGAESPVGSIAVRARRGPAATIRVAYRIRGDLERVRVPASGEDTGAEPLWQQTCCELFLRAPAAAAYHELNFAASGAWAAYAFERYREGGRLMDPSLDPQVRSSTRGGMLELCATIALARLSPAYADAPLVMGVSAVIEARDGSRSYWALVHPAEKPDFHHPDAFALTLDALRD